MLREKRLRKNLDWVLAGAVYALLAISLPVLASATQAPAKGDFSLVQRQAVFIVVGSICALAAMLVNYEDLMRFSRFIYGFNLALLGAVLVVGKVQLGAQRWIQIGPFPLQPSETAKICVIITLAAALSQREEGLNRWSDMIPTFLHILPPMVLVLKQPDLGTSLVFLAIALAMLLVAGAPPGKVGALTVGGLATACGAVFAHFRYGIPLPLKDYQLKRLIVFINPDVDPLRAGYQIKQSIIAIGSGRLLGKGLFAGTQNQLRFLPFQHTDFIFPVIGEELGFIGGTAVLLLYYIVIWRGLRIAATARDRFGSLIATGVTAMIAFHILVNVGMTLGVMPVTGIPLPFMSYGGSSLITNMVGIGLLLNVHLRRQKIQF